MSNVLAFPVPSATGSLDQYIQAVNRFPLLTPEQETSFARKFRVDDDLDAARQLVLSHLRVVVAIARGYLGYGLPHADLIQEGNIGLMKAVKRFDPERGVRLVSFAIHWIKAEMHEFILRNWRLVRIATTKAQRKLFFNLRSMKPGLEPLTQDEIRNVATALRVKPEEVADMEMRLSGQEVALEPAGDDDDTYAPIAYLADPQDEPSKVLEDAEGARLRTAGLANALAELDLRSRRIIEARWPREKDALTLHDLAAEFNVSAERIRQIEVKALEKMRKALPAPV
jgi:RNA polymerase sigma-32 factor